MQGTDHLNRRLSAAVETIARAERLHQYFLKLRPRAGVREPCWEPPIDVLETDREVLILIALPGVDPEQVQGVIEEGAIVVSGRRVLPAEPRDARIHRLELPQGRFEHRIRLPPGRYAITRFSSNGCVGLRPRWTPPDTMVARQPELQRYSGRNGGMGLSLRNPLGARALHPRRQP